MMACWKRNEFRDEACRKEIQAFFDCASKAEVTSLLGCSWEENGGDIVMVLLASCWVIKKSPSHSRRVRKVLGAISPTPKWERLRF